MWDGQYRLGAARMRGIKNPDSYNIFKANVCSGEQIDTAIKDICVNRT